MIPKSIMKQIQLGPRQMTLELEDWTTKNMHRVYSFIENANQRSGPVSLNQLVSEETLIEDMGVLEVLQIAFWLPPDCILAGRGVENSFFHRRFALASPGNQKNIDGPSSRNCVDDDQ